MRDILLGVPLGKQFGSQIRPHIMGPVLRAKLFADKSIFQYSRVDFDNDWKVITFFIGRNDLCDFFDDKVGETKLLVHIDGSVQKYALLLLALGIVKIYSFSSGVLQIKLF